MSIYEEVEKFFYEGVKHYGDGEYDKAIECFTKTINLTKNNPEHTENCASAYYNRGNAYLGKKEYDTAIENYSEAIRLNPNDANAYNNRGNAYGNKKDYNKAIKDCDEAISLEPNLAEAYLNRGNAYSGKKEYDNAIENYSEAIRLNKNYAEAYYNRGNAYLGKKEYDNAIENYSEAIRLNPNLAEAYNNRGLAYSNKKEYDNAIKDFDEVISLEPNDAGAYNNRGATYSGKKEYDNAINSIKELVKNCSHISYRIYFFLVALYEKVKQEDIEETLKCIINKQDNAKIKSLYSYVSFDKNTIDSIMHQYKYASEIFNFNDPADPVIRLIKDYENTKKLFEKVRIACLSAAPLNMLMYSHYTDRHKGICIEYDFSNFNDDDMVLVEVKYENELNIDYNVYELTISGENKQSKDTSFLDLFATKHKNWEYESEYRIISFNKDKIKLPIKSIYLGKNMSDSDKDLLISIAKNVDENIIIYEVSSGDKNLFELKKEIVNK